MATHRRIIIEKHRWLPVQIDDGTDAILIIVLLAGLGLIGYALFTTPQQHRDEMAPADTATTSVPAPASNSVDTGTTSGAGTQ